MQWMAHGVSAISPFFLYPAAFFSSILHPRVEVHKPEGNALGLAFWHCIPYKICKAWSSLGPGPFRQYLSICAVVIVHGDSWTNRRWQLLTGHFLEFWVLLSCFSLFLVVFFVCLFVVAFCFFVTSADDSSGIIYFPDFFKVFKVNFVSLFVVG